MSRTRSKSRKGNVAAIDPNKVAFEHEREVRAQETADKVNASQNRLKHLLTIRDLLREAQVAIDSSVALHQRADGSTFPDAGDLVEAMATETEDLKDRFRRLEPQIAAAYLNLVETIDFESVSFIPEEEAAAAIKTVANEDVGDPAPTLHVSGVNKVEDVPEGLEEPQVPATEWTETAGDDTSAA